MVVMVVPGDCFTPMVVLLSIKGTGREGMRGRRRGEGLWIIYIGRSDEGMDLMKVVGSKVSPSLLQSFCHNWKCLCLTCALSPPH